MRGRSRLGRSNTPAARAPGARSKAAGAVSAIASALRDTAIESAKDGIRNVSEKIGKLAGAGLAVAATTMIEAAGHHPPGWITLGAGYAGAKVGGLVGKAMNTGLDRLTTGGSGPISQIMTDLSHVLQLLQAILNDITNVIHSVNKAQAHYQNISKGARNNLLTNATERCRKAPQHLNNGLQDITEAKDLVSQRLVAIATAGKA